MELEKINHLFYKGNATIEELTAFLMTAYDKDTKVNLFLETSLIGIDHINLNIWK